MGAGADQHKLILGLEPDQPPVRFYVAFSERPSLAGERMRPVSRVERFALQQVLNYRPELVELFAAFLGAFEVPFEVLCGLEPAH